MQVTYEVPTVSQSYSESVQKNPIRWVLLEQVAPDKFINTTKPFKCKDYFNDFVLHKNGYAPFSVHGMWSNCAKFCERGGLYVLVYDVTEMFVKNVENVLHPTFSNTGWGHVEVTPLVGREVTGLGSSRKALLWFSPQSLRSTFRMSVLTLLIRNCNVPFIVNNYDERIDYNLVMDGKLDYSGYRVLKDKNFTFGEQEQYYYYGSKTYNSASNSYNCTYTLHDNGINAWSRSDIFRGIHGSPGWHSLLPTLGGPVEEEDDEGEFYEEEEGAF